MSERFRMVLRKKPGAQLTSVRSRRTVVPPKKDDLSVLTWKEQQMIEKAQLASLKISAQKRRRRKGKRGAGMKRSQLEDVDNESNSSSTSIVYSNKEDTISHGLSSPPVLSPLPPISFNRNVKLECGESKRSKRNKPDKATSSRRQCPSRQSLASIGSLPELLSPCSTAPAPTGGGFAARKSAYMGALSSSDDDEEPHHKGTSNFFGGTKYEDNDDDDAPSCVSKKLPADDSIPAMEDFMSYIVLKGVNCVPDHLKYIGNLQWETVVCKRKSNNSGTKKSPEIRSARGSFSSPSNTPKPEQAWAKKAIERAKRSLVVKQTVKQRSRTPVKSVTTVKNGKAQSSNMKVRSKLLPTKMHSPTGRRRHLDNRQKQVDRPASGRSARLKGSIGRPRKP